MKKDWTGERLETFIYSRDTIDHLHRYAIASQYIVDKIVLDIASGEGYGSNILSCNASFVYGVDIDKETIKNASQKYKKKNIEFRHGSTSSIPLKDQSVDVVVSFETIEHHDQHDEMMHEIKRVLKPGGIVIVSTPDKLFYSDKRKFKNQFHVRELYKDEFINLISKNFEHFQILNQSYINGNSLFQDDFNNERINVYDGDFDAIKTKDLDPMYLIAIASNSVFSKQPESLFDGNKIIAAEVQSKVDYVYKSTTYKLGHLLLIPFKFIGRIIR